MFKVSGGSDSCQATTNFKRNHNIVKENHQLPREQKAPKALTV